MNHGAIQCWMLEASPKRIQQDEQDVKAIIDVIKEKFISPFEEQELISLLIHWCFTKGENSQYLLTNRRLRVVLDGKSSQEYPVNARVPQGSILGPTLFLLYINELPDDVICDIAIYDDDTTLKG